MRPLALVALAAIAPSLTAGAQTVGYSSRGVWLASLNGRTPTLISFDEAALNPGQSLGVAPSRYAARAAGGVSILMLDSPTSGAGEQPRIYRPTATDQTNGLVPASGLNLVSLDQFETSGNSNGVLRLDFPFPARAVGLIFIDVELAATPAACSLASSPATVQLTSANGNGTRQFLGLAAPAGSTLASVTVSVGSQSLADAVFLDNLEILPAACSLADVASLGGALTPDGQVTADDLVAFLRGFFMQTAPGDVATVGGAATPDGQYTADDVVVYIQLFFAGCVG
jgi:hypothetical protein